MRSIDQGMVFIGLSPKEAEELIAELDHDDNGMGGGYSALGEKVKDRLAAHIGFMKAVEGGDDDFIRIADEKMTALYPDS